MNAPGFDYRRFFDLACRGLDRCMREAAEYFEARAGWYAGEADRLREILRSAQS
jgi:hypothetical protein